MAPTRKPSSSPSVSPKTHKYISKKSSGSSTEFSSRIETVVRNTYWDVKSRRSSERERLVRSVLDESLDDIVMSSLAEQKQRAGVTNSRVSISRDVHSISSHRGKEKTHKKEKHKKKDKRESKQNGVAVSSKKRKHIEGEVDSSPASRGSKMSNRSNSHSTNGIKGDDAMTNGHVSVESASEVAANLTEIADMPRQRMVFPRLPSNDCSRHIYFDKSPFNTEISAGKQELLPSKPHNMASDRKHAITIKLHNPTSRTEVNTTHQPLLLEGAHPPRPSSSSVIFLKSFFSAADERNLAHVPYFGEENNEDFAWDLFDIEERMKLYEYGPPYCEYETIDTIDEVLRLLAEREPTWFVNNPTWEIDEEDTELSPQTQSIKLVHTILAELSNVNVKRVQERHALSFGDNKNDNKSNKQQAISETSSTPSRTHKKSDTKEGPSCYEDAINTYRDLFCRICFTYDCQIHGNIPKANLQLLGELAVAKANEGHWKEVCMVAHKLLLTMLILITYAH
jgi:hypothetical protein